MALLLTSSLSVLSTKETDLISATTGTGGSSGLPCYDATGSWMMDVVLMGVERVGYPFPPGERVIRLDPGW